jgi:hypothetical protein
MKINKSKISKVGLLIFSTFLRWSFIILKVLFVVILAILGTLFKIITKTKSKSSRKIR